MAAIDLGRYPQARHHVSPVHIERPWALDGRRHRLPSAVVAPPRPFVVLARCKLKINRHETFGRLPRRGWDTVTSARRPARIRIRT